MKKKNKTQPRREKSGEDMLKDALEKHRTQKAEEAQGFVEGKSWTTKDEKKRPSK